MYTFQQPEYHKSGCSDHFPPLRLVSVTLRGGRGLVFREGGGVHYSQKQLKMGAHFF